MIKSMLACYRKIKRNRANNNIIKHLKRKNPKLKAIKFDPKYDQEIRDYWEFLKLPIDTRWHHFYSTINGIKKPEYLPESIFFSEFIPRLGKIGFSKAYEDKNIYDMLFSEVRRPKTILRNIHGRYYDENYNQISQLRFENQLKIMTGNFVIKPSLMSSQGKGVKLLKIDNGKLFINKIDTDIKSIVEEYYQDFLIQEFVEQHSFLNQIHSSSLNTFRLVSYRNQETVKVLSSVVRFGTDDNFVDNFSSGGIAVGISENGQLKHTAIDKYLNTYSNHPNSKVIFEDIVIPQYESLTNLVQDLHKRLVYFDLASWDFALDLNLNYVFIEINLGMQGIDIHQALNGPLFGVNSNIIYKELFMRRK